MKGDKTMEFKWKQINQYTIILFGYDDQKIASVEWNSNYEIWELKSEWFEHSSDISDEFGLTDIEEVKKDALEQLKETCDEYIAWYKKQIDMIEELYQDTCLKQSSLASVTTKNRIRKENARMKAKLFFRWFDLWIGCYIDKKNKAVYICPIPMVGIKVWKSNL